MGCESVQGEVANSTSSTGSALCQYTNDGFVNFEIDFMFFEFSFDFLLNQNATRIPPNTDYASGEIHGIIDGEVTTLRYFADGSAYDTDILTIPI